MQNQIVGEEFYIDYSFRSLNLASTLCGVILKIKIFIIKNNISFCETKNIKQFFQKFRVETVERKFSELQVNDSDKINAILITKTPPKKTFFDIQRRRQLLRPMFFYFQILIDF